MTSKIEENLPAVQKSGYLRFRPIFGVFCSKSLLFVKCMLCKVSESNHYTLGDSRMSLHADAGGLEPNLEQFHEKIRQMHVMQGCAPKNAIFGVFFREIASNSAPNPPHRRVTTSWSPQGCSDSILIPYITCI